MLVAFSVSCATGTDDGTIHDALAPAIRAIRESGLPYRTDSMFTTIEGTWDECMGLVKRCCEILEAQSPRVSLVLKADIRPGFTGEMTAKLERLEQAIEASSNAD